MRFGLPARYGGLGLRTASSFCHAAYLGSVLDCHPLVSSLLAPSLGEHVLPSQYDVLYNRFLTSYQIDPSLVFSIETLLSSKESSQRQLSGLLSRKRAAELLDHFTLTRDFHRARVMASAVGQLNTSWVEFLPYPGGSYKLLPPEVFRVALKMYCGKDVYCPPGSRPRVCPSCPTGVLDPLGLHALCCAGGHFTRTSRHNRVASTLSDAAKGTILYGGQEVPHLLGANKKKPADVLLHCYRQDQDAAVDVSVTDISEQHVPYSNFSSSVHLPESDFFAVLRSHLVTNSGSPFTAVENKKTQAVGELCKANNLIFKVFAVGSFGGFGDAALEVLRKIASQRAIQDDVHTAVALRRICMDISLALQRAQASAVLHRGVAVDCMYY